MKKNPGLAALLSFFFPGTGFIYCERVIRGILIFLICEYLLFETIVNWSVWVLLLTVILWIANVYSGLKEAHEYNDKIKPTP